MVVLVVAVGEVEDIVGEDQFMCGGACGCWLLLLDELTSSASSISLFVGVLLVRLVSGSSSAGAIGVIEHGVECE